jgi:hypothetical protein
VLLRPGGGRYLLFPGHAYASANKPCVHPQKDERRRYSVSYAISIALHLLLIGFFLGVAGSDEGSPDEGQQVSAQVISVSRAGPPVLTISRRARVATPAPIRRPAASPPATVVQRPAAAPVRAAAPSVQREIARPLRRAPLAARATPSPVALAAAPTAAPATPQPVSAQTLPPEDAPIVARTEPTLPPENAPIARQIATPEPTVEPTVAPTRAPTAAPTVAPTVAPTLAPRTPAPTVAPSTPVPTMAPRPVAPTAAPTVAPRPATPAPEEPSRVQTTSSSKPESRPGSAVAARSATPAAVALAPPRPPEQRNAAEILNERLKALTLKNLLPSSPVTYSQKHYSGADIALLGQRVENEWAAALAPPASIIAQIFGIVTKRTTDLQPASITYLYKKTFFGLCMGWYVIEHPLSGGHPETGYTITPCREGTYTPVKPGSLVFPSPSPPARPQEAVSPRS